MCACSICMRVCKHVCRYELTLHFAGSLHWSFCISFKCPCLAWESAGACRRLVVAHVVDGNIHKHLPCCILLWRSGCTDGGIGGDVQGFHCLHASPASQPQHQLELDAPVPAQARLVPQRLVPQRLVPAEVRPAQGLVALPALVGNWCWSSAAGGPHTQHTPHWMRPAVELVSSLACLGCEKTAETLPRLTAAGLDSISISFPVKKSPFATLCEFNFLVKQKGPPPRFEYPAPVRSENDAWRVHRRDLHRWRCEDIESSPLQSRSNIRSLVRTRYTGTCPLAHFEQIT